MTSSRTDATESGGLSPAVIAGVIVAVVLLIGFVVYRFTRSSAPNVETIAVPSFAPGAPGHRPRAPAPPPQQRNR